uniref:DNA-directed RNA polymerase n=1 Tax=Rhabditophanes sp. KR3021 TaxID=114890 RepID=A0AC35UCT8_9BILA
MKFLFLKFTTVQEYGVAITFYNPTFLPGCNLFDYTIRKSPGLRTTSVSTELCNHYLLTKTCYEDSAFRIKIDELLKESYNLSLIKDLVKPVVSEDNCKKKMGKYDILVEAGRCIGIPIKANFDDDPNKVKSSVSTYALSDLLFESKKAFPTFGLEQRNKFRHVSTLDFDGMTSNQVPALEYTVILDLQSDLTEIDAPRKPNDGMLMKHPEIVFRISEITL